MTRGEYQSSNTRLAPVRTAWDGLSSVLHEYSRACFIDETAPDLLNCFQRVEKQYETFLGQAKTIFNNARPSKNAVGIRPTSAIEKICLDLIAEWAQFFQTFDTVKRVGSGPIYRLMAAKFSFLSQMLQTFSNIFSEPQPLVAIGAVRKVRLEIDRLRLRSNELKNAVTYYAYAVFDPNAFEKQLRCLNDGIRHLFSRVIPRASMGIGSIVSTKRELFVVCDDLLSLFSGVQSFGERSSEVFGAIEDMNDAFNELFETLGLPERIDMSSPEEEEELEAFFAEEEVRTFMVFLPTVPSCDRPLRFWNALTASSVCEPK
jgi:hypothetical protein